LVSFHSFLLLSFVVLTSLKHLDELLYIARQGLPMKMLLNGLDGLSFARMSQHHVIPINNLPLKGLRNDNFIAKVVS
jgi:hypothetical protein